MKNQMIRLMVVLFTCLLPVGVAAGEIDITMEWTYNGVVELNTEGFRLYQEAPDGAVLLVSEIAGADTRVWSGMFSAQVGRSLYYLTAYSAEAESPRSAAYPFEYMEPVTSGMPAPTVIIRFN